MDLTNIIRPGDDPMGEDPTYTLTLSVSQALAIKDAVACLWTATQALTSADDCYGQYDTCGFMEEAHQVADQLEAMMRPHVRRVGQHIRMLTDAEERRN